MADINELAFAGYWFYGASTDAERAMLYASYGLLEEITPLQGNPVGDWFYDFYDGREQ